MLLLYILLAIFLYFKFFKYKNENLVNLYNEDVKKECSEKSLNDSVFSYTVNKLNNHRFING